MIEFDHISFSYAPSVTAAVDAASNAEADNAGVEAAPVQSAALDNISLSLAPGEYVVLLGRNGSGKSTLARLGNALLLPTTGEVRVDGMCTSDAKHTRDIRMRVGLVAQDPESQIVSSTVLDEVAFGPENLGLPREEIRVRVEEAIRAVGLEGKETREPHGLSGGEKQRLVIAGILAMRPCYVLFDEPLSMLDVIGRREVRTCIERLHARGHGILHITHDLDECLAADRVVVLEAGSIIFEGTPRELLDLLGKNLSCTKVAGFVQPSRRDCPHADKPQLTGFSFSPMLSLAFELERSGVVLPGNPLHPAALAGAVVQLVESPSYMEKSVSSQPSQEDCVPDGKMRVREANSQTLQVAVTAHSQDNLAPASDASSQENLAPASDASSQGSSASTPDAFSQGSSAFAPVAPVQGSQKQHIDNPLSTGLRIESCSYQYARGTSLAHQALENVSLEVLPGDLCLIAGETGSGKSTLLRIAAGLLKPDAGSASCDGKAIEAGIVGLVFQQPEAQLFAETVLADVSFGPRNLHVPLDEVEVRAQDALRQVGLDPFEYGARSPFSLSGGQARRVAIAGVLAMQPTYLLLDEPTAGLDGAGRAFVAELLARLRASGTGIVVVSHDIDEFLGVASDVMLLKAGHVVWSGSASALIGDPNLFARASLELPSILAFQERLGCMRGCFSFDVQRIAAWALAGFPAGGPGGSGPHTHSHACSQGHPHTHSHACSQSHPHVQSHGHPFDGTQPHQSTCPSDDQHASDGIKPQTSGRS